MSVLLAGSVREARGNVHVSAHLRSRSQRIEKEQPAEISADKEAAFITLLTRKDLLVSEDHAHSFPQRHLPAAQPEMYFCVRSV